MGESFTIDADVDRHAHTCSLIFHVSLYPVFIEFQLHLGFPRIERYRCFFIYRFNIIHNGKKCYICTAIIYILHLEYR